MEGKDRAQHYEEHDKDETWGEPEYDPPKDRNRFSETITVRFPPDEAERIRRIAKATDATYSDVLRTAMREYDAPAAPRMTITQTTPNQRWEAGSLPKAVAMRTAAIVIESPYAQSVTTSSR